MLERLGADLIKLENKERFILMVIAGELELRNKPKVDVVRQLIKKGFASDAKDETAIAAAAAAAASDEQSDNETDVDARGFEYLLGLPLWSLTLERVQKLRTEREGKQTEFQTLRETDPLQLWLTDLDKLEVELTTFEQQLRAASAGSKKLKGGRVGAAAAKKGKRAAKAGSDSDSDDTTTATATTSRCASAPIKQAAARAAPKPVVAAAPVTVAAAAAPAASKPAVSKAKIAAVDGATSIAAAAARGAIKESSAAPAAVKPKVVRKPKAAVISDSDSDAAPGLHPRPRSSRLHRLLRRRSLRRLWLLAPDLRRYCCSSDWLCGWAHCLVLRHRPLLPLRRLLRLQRMQMAQAASASCSRQAPLQLRPLFLLPLLAARRRRRPRARPYHLTVTARAMLCHSTALTRALTTSARRRRRSSPSVPSRLLPLQQQRQL